MNEGYEMRCGNCYWFNGEKGDYEQFCDEREQDVHESGYCFRWKKKDVES